ncbi:MAG: TRAP transporter small permease [Rubrivivax sp.]
MHAARQALLWMQRLEQGGTTLAFVVMVVVLAWDILGRELLGGGKIWATPVAVYANVFLAFIGIGVASAHGAHMRPRFLDKLGPRRWDGTLDRIGDAGFALFSVAAAWLCLTMLRESIELAETDPVLQVQIWPMQGILVAGFILAAVRHALYARYPDLRPAPDAGEGPPPEAPGPT